MKTATPAEFLAALQARDFANGNITRVSIETEADTLTFSRAEESPSSSAFIDAIGEAINGLIADTSRLRIDEETSAARVVTLDYAGAPE